MRLVLLALDIWAAVSQQKRNGSEVLGCGEP